MLKNILATIGALTLVKFGYEYYEKYQEAEKKNELYQKLLKKHHQDNDDASNNTQE